MNARTGSYQKHVTGGKPLPKWESLDIFFKGKGRIPIITEVKKNNNTKHDHNTFFGTPKNASRLKKKGLNWASKIRLFWQERSGGRAKRYNLIVLLFEKLFCSIIIYLWLCFWALCRYFPEVQRSSMLVPFCVENSILIS